MAATALHRPLIVPARLSGYTAYTVSYSYTASQLYTLYSIQHYTASLRSNVRASRRAMRPQSSISSAGSASVVHLVSRCRWASSVSRICERHGRSSARRGVLGWRLLRLRTSWNTANGLCSSERFVRFASGSVESQLVSSVVSGGPMVGCMTGRRDSMPPVLHWSPRRTMRRRMGGGR